MKPSSAQLEILRKRIHERLKKNPKSYAEIARATGVDPSQVGRICTGHFKTFSNNLVQICRVIGVRVPRLDAKSDVTPEWREVHASVNRICRDNPGGAALVGRVLDALADFQS